MRLFKSRAPGGGPIRGSLIDAELQANGKSIGLRYLLENEASVAVAINQADDHLVFAQARPGGRVEVQGSFRNGCGVELPKQPFLLLEAGKTAILSSCISDPKLYPLLLRAGFTETYREVGKMRLSAGPSGLALELKLGAIINGRKPAEVRIDLRTGH